MALLKPRVVGAAALKKCPFVSYESKRNRWVARRSSVVPGRKVFNTFRAACRYAHASLGAALPRTPTQRVIATMRALSRVYGRPLIPADLADAVARSMADGDVFQDEPCAEIISIMLKYRPVRICFAAALRNSTLRAGAVKEVRAQRICECLQRCVKDCSKVKVTKELQVWSAHWGLNVSHHSAWLPFLQRPAPTCSKTRHLRK